jgi:hypothetical protein
MNEPHRLRGWNLDEIAPPPGVSLLAHVEQLLPESGRGPIANGGHPLPDEPPRDPSKLPWGGAHDALAAVGRFAEPTDTSPLTAAAAVLDLTSSELTQRRVDVALDRLDEVVGPSQMDRLLKALRAGPNFDRRRVATFARWVCTFGTRRQVVKTGAAMLGVSGVPGDRDLVMRLGLLDHLSLFALVALTNLLPPTDVEGAIFELAPQMEGWGRIHAIKRLKDTQRPDVRSWLVRGGASIEPWLTEEIAYIAATTGHLAEAVAGEIDDELFDGAGDLLRALAVGGPAGDMADYPDSGFVLHQYLDRARSVSPSAKRLEDLVTIERYLIKPWKENPHLTPDERTELRTMVGDVLGEDRWRAFVETSLRADDLRVVRPVVAKASRFGVDPRPTVVAWLDKEPLDAYLWQSLVMNSQGDELRAVIDRAIELLPLNELESGPADDLGGGPGYEADNCLGVIVQRLKGEPGLGWPLVRVALRTRVHSTRSAALRTLASWPRDTWPADAAATVTSAMWAEPREERRKAMRDLLENEHTA